MCWYCTLHVSLNAFSHNICCEKDSIKVFLSTCLIPFCRDWFLLQIGKLSNSFPIMLKPISMSVQFHKRSPSLSIIVRSNLLFRSVLFISSSIVGCHSVSEWIVSINDPCSKKTLFNTSVYFLDSIWHMGDTSDTNR